MYISSFKWIFAFRKLYLLSDGEKLLGLYYGNKGNYLETLNPDELIEKDDLPIFEQTRQWLEDYVKHKKPSFEDLPIVIEGDELNLAVWNVFMSIPYGQTISFFKLVKYTAKRLNRRFVSWKAVANAIVQNPFFVIIPTHRFWGRLDIFVKYQAGFDMKLRLLIHEGAYLEMYSIEIKEYIRNFF